MKNLRQKVHYTYLSDNKKYKNITTNFLLFINSLNMGVISMHQTMTDEISIGLMKDFIMFSIIIILILYLTYRDKKRQDIIDARYDKLIGRMMDNISEQQERYKKEIVAEVRELSSAISKVFTGVERVVVGVNDVQKEATKVTDSVRDVSAGVAEVSAGVTEVSSGVEKVVNEVDRVTDGVKDVSEGIKEVVSKLQNITDKIDEVSKEKDKISKEK